MGIEIERRFLVKGEDWRKYANKPQLFKQGYLASNKKGWSIRIRIIDNKEAYLTLKAQANIATNHEYEYSIPLEEANEIWNLVPHKLLKTRYQLSIHGGSWIVDCFHDKNAPLVIAEVELPSRDVLINKPSWCIEEITGKYEWSNAALSKIH